MADSSRTVKISFVGDAKSFSEAIRGMEQQSEGLGSKLGGIFGGIAKLGTGLAVFDLAAGGVGRLKDTLGGLADAADESARVQAQTVQAIQSTGGAANISADHVANFATSLSQVAPFDDEVIQSGENLLLTFTNLRDEAGKGNDIFDQSTKIMLDMSQALGQDTKTSAIQLGKALNDPINGMSALQRVGVSFTDSQKKQITALQQSGDLMGAQKIILAELTKEFGGSAEAAGKTFGGQLTILKTQLGNVEEALGAALLPALTAVASKGIPYVVEAGNKAGDLVTNVLIPGISSLAGKLDGPLSSGFQTAGALVDRALPKLREFGDWFEQTAQFITGTLIPAIQQFAAIALPPIKEFIGFLIDHKGDVIAAVTGVALAFGIWTAATTAQELATKGMTLAQEALDAVMAASPVGLAILAIAAASVLLYEAWQHDWGGIREITKQVLDWLQANIPPILAAIQGGISAFVGFVKLLFDGDWSKAWQQLQAVVSDAKDWLVTTGLPALWTALQGFFTDTLPKIGAQLAAWGLAFVQWVAPQIPPLLLELGKLYVALYKWLIEVALPQIVSNLAQWGAQFVAWVAPRIPPLLLELGKLLLSLGDWLLTTALPAIVSKLSQWAGAFTAWVAPRIPPLLVELGKLLLSLGDWLLTTALPRIVEKLGEWGKAFAQWVPGATTDLLAKLGDMLVSLGKWIVTSAAPEMASKMADAGKAAGSALVDAILKAIQDSWGNISDWIGKHVPSIPFVGGGGGGGGGGSASALGFIKPIAGQFVQGFYTGTHRVESAIDWAAPRGTPVYAPGAGTIVATGFNLDGDSGRGLALLTPSGWEFVTGHMSGLVVSDGQAVARGQLIGYSGSPELDGGAGSGAHLHMAIRHNGAYVGGSPADYIPLAKGGIVTGPTLALLGDNATGQEAVLPIDDAHPVPVTLDSQQKLTIGGPGSEPVPVMLVSGSAGDTVPMPVTVVGDASGIPYYAQKYAKQITGSEPVPVTVVGDASGIPYYAQKYAKQITAAQSSATASQPIAPDIPPTAPGFQQVGPGAFLSGGGQPLSEAQADASVPGAIAFDGALPAGFTLLPSGFVQGPDGALYSLNLGVRGHGGTLTQILAAPAASAPAPSAAPVAQAGAQQQQQQPQAQAIQQQTQAMQQVAVQMDRVYAAIIQLGQTFERHGHEILIDGRRVNSRLLGVQTDQYAHLLGGRA